MLCSIARERWWSSVDHQSHPSLVVIIIIIVITTISNVTTVALSIYETWPARSISLQINATHQFSQTENYFKAADPALEGQTVRPSAAFSVWQNSNFTFAERPIRLTFPDKN